MSRTTFWSSLSLVTIVLFVGLLGTATALYPGGSWADESAAGFDPVRNYWCDLMRRDAINGEANPGSFVAKASFCAIGLSVASLFHAAGVLVPRKTATLASRGGVVTAVFVVLVAAVAYEEFRVFHAAASMSAGVFGLSTLVLVVKGSWGAQDLRAARRVLGALLFASGGVTAAVYANAIYHQDHSAVLPVAQKVATVFIVLWVATTAVAAKRRARKEGSA